MTPVSPPDPTKRFWAGLALAGIFGLLLLFWPGLFFLQSLSRGASLGEAFYWTFVGCGALAMICGACAFIRAVFIGLIDNSPKGKGR